MFRPRRTAEGGPTFSLGRWVNPSHCEIKSVGWEGDEEIRWHRRASAEKASRLIHSLVEQETDRRVAIWLRVRLGRERMTEVAEDYGYRDGSGVHRVLQRLEEKAQHDRSLARHLKKLAEQVSCVKS